MSNNKITNKKLINLLTKLANGFYYSEEQVEYQKTQNKVKNIENYNNNAKNISFFDYDVTGKQLFENDYDKIKSSNETETISNKNLTLSKKKITTHYVQPDISAIKILFEINRKKVDKNDIESMSDDELIKLKNKLIEELSNEN